MERVESIQLGSFDSFVARTWKGGGLVLPRKGPPREARPCLLLVGLQMETKTRTIGTVERGNLDRKPEPLYSYFFLKRTEPVLFLCVVLGGFSCFWLHHVLRIDRTSETKT